MSTEKASSLPVNLPVPVGDDEGAEYWQSHIDSWVQSGLSQAAYCRRHHLNYDKFRTWKGRLHTYPTSRSSIKLVEVKRDFKLNVNAQSPFFGCNRRVRGSADHSYVNNMPMRPGVNGVGHCSGIRFWCGQFCIEIDVQFSSESLSQLIRTLQRLQGLQMPNAVSEEIAES